MHPRRLRWSRKGEFALPLAARCVFVGAQTKVSVRPNLRLLGTLCKRPPEFMLNRSGDDEIVCCCLGCSTHVCGGHSVGAKRDDERRYGHWRLDGRLRGLCLTGPAGCRGGSVGVGHHAKAKVIAFRPRQLRHTTCLTLSRRWSPCCPGWQTHGRHWLVFLVSLHWLSACGRRRRVDTRGKPRLSRATAVAPLAPIDDLAPSARRPARAVPGPSSIGPFIGQSLIIRY